MRARFGRLHITTAIAVVATVLCAATALIATAPGAYASTNVAIARVLIVAVPFAVGAYAASRSSSRRFGWLMVAAGAGNFLATLAESGEPALYSTGRVAYWALEAFLIYLVLAFPTGRLTSAIDRRLAWAAALLVLTLYIPTAFVVDGYPVHAPYTSCESGCPENAFQVTASEPAFIDAVVRPLRELLAIALFVVATLRLGSRVRGANRLRRLGLSPVLYVAIGRCGVFAAALTLRGVDPGSWAVSPLMWLLALAVPALGIGFLVGLLRWRLYIGDALQRFAHRLHDGTPPGGIRAPLAEVFEDPNLTLAYASRDAPERWITPDGRAASLPVDDPDRAITYVSDSHGLQAAIVHDAALRDEPYFTEAVADYAGIALDNEHLNARVKASMRELRRSRARLVASADRERKRIERDLHDGAQQRLVALQMRLGLAEELLDRDPSAARERIHAVNEELAVALDEIRSLGRGVYPPLLADRGLEEALRAAARRASLPARVVTHGLSRLSPEVEAAVYFCCLEAMQNASKHATGATGLTIWLRQTRDALDVDVRDDGHGFDQATVSPGSGTANMRDRIAAVGGELSVLSVLASGTVVHAHVPLT